MDSKNDILSYVKQKTLKNAFNNSNRDFLSLFPQDNFDFSSSEYTHFLYFSTEEAIAYITDFMYFIKSYYNEEVFSYENYFSVFEEFKKYCENNKIFLYTKTKMGLSLANYNNDLLLNALQNIFGEKMVLGNDSDVAFSEVILKDKTNYSYPFFDYLCEKTKGYNNYKFIVEPLVNQDIKKIQDYYKGFPYKGNLPFFLDPNKPYWKETKAVVLSEIVSNTPSKVYAISKQDKTNVSLIIAQVVGTKCELTILCDSDYYNSDLSYALDFVCRHLFDSYEIDEITTTNINKGIAFSGVNSTLVISHFKPSYNSESSYDGFSKITYELSRSTNLEIEILTNNSVINFAI